VDIHSIQELIQVARTRYDDDEGSNPGWDALRILHTQASQEVLDTARKLAHSGDSADRTLAADILAQLGHTIEQPKGVFFEERVTLLIEMLEKDKDESVLSAAAVGVGHMDDIRFIPTLLALKNHASENVRFGVAFGLVGLDDDRAIDTLIKLSADKDAHVRDWATFGLGQQSDRDTPDIRNAFVRRLEDPDEHGAAYEEAIAGLAKRHDARVFDFVLKAIQENQGSKCVFEAVIDLADPRLLPDLLRLKVEHGNEYKSYEGLEEAIAACQGSSLE